MSKNYIVYTDLTKYGFVDNVLETEKHIVKYSFYDVGRLEIKSKLNMGNDDVFLECYFNPHKFFSIITNITSHKF